MKRILIATLLLAAASAAHSQGNEPDDSEIVMDNPGSITDRLEQQTERKDYLYRGFTGSLERWYDHKAELEEKHGFKYGISLTMIYQKADDTFGPEDDASGYDLDLSGTWKIKDEQSDSTTIGFQIFTRDDMGSELTPQVLFTQYGGLYSSAGPFGETDPTIGQLWLQKKYGDRFGFQIGQLFPISAYDFFPFKNFRTDFVDFNHATNATIPLPDYGLGALVRYKPAQDMRLTVGIHDANADAEKSGTDTYDGELFTYVEIAFDRNPAARMPGRPPSHYAHVSFWHQDELEDAGVEDGWGVGFTGVRRIGRYSPYLRLGYADVDDVGGPTSVESMFNIGVAIDEIFGQARDRIVIGYTLAEPANGALDDQHAIDAYYRVQLTPEIQIGPTIHFVIDPVSNPDEDEVLVGGMRLRLAI